MGRGRRIEIFICSRGPTMKSVNSIAQVTPYAFGQSAPSRELVIDSFCGGGGVSRGMEMALGFSPDIAINHDMASIMMHMENHPHTLHLLEDVWHVNMREALSPAAGRRWPLQTTSTNNFQETWPVGLLWASPDCKDFSRAKSGKPLSKNIRSLAWVVVKWAKIMRPRVVIVENVPEFAAWSPLIRDPRFPKTADRWIRNPKRKGETFRRWVKALRSLGYNVEWRVLSAADYGAPTRRERLFVIARLDGEAIVWPKPTHGARDRNGNPPRGLLPHVEVSICIEWNRPTPSIFDPEARRRAGLKPVLAPKTMKRIASGLLRYVIRSKKPFIVRMGHYSNITGEGGGFRGQGLDRPLAAICGTNDKALVVPVVARADGLSAERSALVTSWLAKHYKGVVGSEVSMPIGAITSIDHHSLVTAHLLQYNGQSIGGALCDTLPTQTGVDHHALVASCLVKLRGQCHGAPMDEPAPTITAQGTHIAEVRALLNLLDQSKLTDTERLGLVEVDGVLYQIVDVGLRMLSPRELLKAQMHPDIAKDYRLTGTAKSQVQRVGNSVPPLIVKAMVQANFTPRVFDDYGNTVPANENCAA